MSAAAARLFVLGFDFLVFVFNFLLIVTDSILSAVLIILIVILTPLIDGVFWLLLLVIVIIVVLLSCLTLLATGTGKSLIYQLASFLYKEVSTRL